MEPLPGVCKLKSLSLHANNLFAVDGSLTFPSLTNLTRLEVRYVGAGDVIFLKVCDISSRVFLFRAHNRRFLLGTHALCLNS